MSGRKSIPQVFFQQSKRTLSNIKLQLIPKLLYSANRRQNPSFEARVTWDQALFSFRFENYIPAGMTKRKESPNFSGTR